MPNLETMGRLERWVVTAYGESKCSATIKAISELRWYLYSKFQSDISDLPPTTAALEYKIFRCHYIALLLRKSLLTMQELPSPLSYGWESYRELSVSAIMTKELLFPIALIELCVCACKTKCVNNRCKCRKNKLRCTGLC